MRKITKAVDFSGREVHKGDTVSTLSGSMTAKVCDLAVEPDNTMFVCLRAVHQPFSRGVWHAADQVQLVAGKRK
jgi:hypothetical protein